MHLFNQTEGCQSSNKTMTNLNRHTTSFCKRLVFLLQKTIMVLILNLIVSGYEIKKLQDKKNQRIKMCKTCIIAAR